MARAHGLACNTIVAADVVLADGRIVRTDAETEPELLWALRGGSGNVGAVTALEMELLPLPEIYAGALFWPIERAAEILARLAGVDRRRAGVVPVAGQDAPAPRRAVPARPPAGTIVRPRRGGDHRPAADGDALVAPLRALGPAIDTMAVIPTQDLSLVNMDPDFPLPYVGEGILLADLPDEAIERVVEAFTGSPLLHVEVRHLGGALARRSPEHGVLDAIDEPFLAFTFGLTPDAEARTAVAESVAGVLASLEPWDSGRRYLNFAETPMDPALDLPARVVRAAARREGTLRPDRPVPGQPLGRRARRRLRRRHAPGAGARAARRRAARPAAPSGRRPAGAGPCCA